MQVRCLISAILMSLCAPASAADISLLQWVEMAAESSTVASSATGGINEEGERFWSSEGWREFSKAQASSGNPTALTSNEMMVAGDVRNLTLVDSPPESPDKHVAEGIVSLTYKSAKTEFIADHKIRVYAKGDNVDNFRVLSMQIY